MAGRTKTETDTEPEPGITAADWSVGNGPLQVPLAGLLVHDPSLATATLSPSEWQKKLDEYLRTERI